MFIGFRSEKLTMRTDFGSEIFCLFRFIQPISLILEDSPLLMKLLFIHIFRKSTITMKMS
jgi:hypothetical protein